MYLSTKKIFGCGVALRCGVAHWVLLGSQVQRGSLGAVGWVRRGSRVQCDSLGAVGWVRCGSRVRRDSLGAVRLSWQRLRLL
jgi:hypothetical protein